ncbi:MAG: SMI1/KNR4 family protein [Coriobacteriales bacterium]|nr:SMI1/KNR4 family protein [Coriobacteriales bacterium]
MSDKGTVPYHVNKLKDAVGPMMKSSIPPSPERVARFESMYELKLPSSIRAMTEALGDTRGTRTKYHLLGLSDDRAYQPTISSVLAYMRSNYPSLPKDLLPVESLPENQVACAVLDGSDNPPVCMIDLDDPEFYRMPLAPNYSAFCLDWLNDLRGMEAMLAFLKQEEEAVKRGKRSEDQMYRPNEWRTCRSCSQDVFVGTSLLRYNRDTGITEVASFACAGLTAHDPDTPVRAMLTSILSESYKSGGDLALQFVTKAVSNPRPVRVPARIERFAKSRGIRIADVRGGLIAPEEAKMLFISSLVCPESYRALMLSARSEMDAGAACFVVASGLWDAISAEHLLRNAYDPPRILAGSATPLDAISWAADIRDAATAYLVGSYVKWLNARDSLDSRFDTEDKTGTHTATLTDYGTAVLSSAADSPSEVEGQLSGRSIEVLAVYGSADELDGKLVQLAEWLKQSVRCDNAALLLCKDSESRNAAELKSVEEQCGIQAMYSPLYSTTVMSEAMKKLEKARMSRL